MLNKNPNPLVVICGRTNVGKSTLFNCLTEKRQALVSSINGTTRDSNLGTVEWGNAIFDLVDTAGMIDSRILNIKKIVSSDIDIKAQKQAKAYLKKANLILFLVDAKTGLLSEDKKLAEELKKNDNYRLKTLVVANKIDNFKSASEAAQFNKLGFKEPLIVSATTGLGSGDLLDIIVKKINKNKKKAKNSQDPKTQMNVCIIGQPNVGKSSLLNSILGYERVIVSPIPHTTREPQNTKITYQDQEITIVDTAGITRRHHAIVGLEKFGILKSLKSLEKSDIALLILDISKPLTHQDAKLVQEIVDRRKSLIIVANKWDAVENHNTKKWTEIIYDKLPFVTWAPIQFISAKTGKKVDKILDLVKEINIQRNLQLSDSQCEKFMKAVVKIHKPAKGKGTKIPHIYEFRQIKNNPPLFILRIGPQDDLHFSYVRFMKNRLRERHGFLGTPIHIKVVQNKKSHTTYNF